MALVSGDMFWLGNDLYCVSASSSGNDVHLVNCETGLDQEVRTASMFRHMERWVLWWWCCFMWSHRSR